jgi:hypothetical protein
LNRNKNHFQYGNVYIFFKTERGPQKLKVSVVVNPSSYSRPDLPGLCSLGNTEESISKVEAPSTPMQDKNYGCQQGPTA